MRYSTPGIDGWMSADELHWLYDTATRMNSIVEVGSWLGRSTHALCSGCAGTVYAVDHWLGSPDEREGNHKLVQTADVYELFIENLKEFVCHNGLGCGNLMPFKMDSLEAAELFSGGKYGQIDMVFIDGDHRKDNVLADLKAWCPLAKKILCGHDFSQNGVEKAVEEFGMPFERVPGMTIWTMNMEVPA
jgi:predicted O-methyltransferase YrrM